jgi:poly-gamma-glutamate capsule biosynthesis protein CapA/YwtB (metallophosphatase superfamily)
METVKVLLTGDFCPVLRIEQLARQNLPHLVFNDMLHEFQGSDLNVIDLECPLIEGGKPIIKTGPNIKASPETINLLKFARINLAAMANNHILDYGDEGLSKTVKLCQENGIGTVGIGRNLNEARNPYSVTIKGLKLKIINITENEWSITNGNVPGANPLDLINNYRDISQAKSQADVVIIIFHGGNEFYELPSPRVKETLHYFAEAGATAIISHHTHVSSGYEIYKGVPIFYSLGNFCYDIHDHHDREWNYGFAVLLKISEKIDFEIIPVVQNKEKPGVFKLNGPEKNAFLGRIKYLSGIISNDELLKERFADYSRENAYRYDLLFEPYRNKYIAFLKKRGFFPSLISKRKKRLFLDIIRCEAHRDLIINYLNKYR